MAIMRWDPLRDMLSLQRDMNRLFDGISVTDGTSGKVQGSANSLGLLPLAEMEESEDKIHLKLELPGMDADDLDIRVMKKAVTVSGERKTESTSEENGQRRSEFRYGSFSRTIPLPVPVDNDNVEAAYKDGILTLALPKVEDQLNRAVKVSLNGSSQSASAQISASSNNESSRELETAQ